MNTLVLLVEEIFSLWNNAISTTNFSNFFTTYWGNKLCLVHHFLKRPLLTSLLLCINH